MSVENNASGTPEPSLFDTIARLKNDVPVQKAEQKLTQEALEAKADKAAIKAAEMTGNVGGILGIAAVVIGAAGIADMAMKHQDKMRMERQKDIQLDQEEKKESSYAQYKSDAYQSVLDMGNIPLNAYNNRTGHSNSWGGKRY